MRQRPEIFDANLAIQLEKVPALNANDSLLQSTQMTDLNHDDNVETIKVSKYFTMSVSGKRQSLWWDGFELFVPSKHPNLYSEHVMCLACSKSCSPTLAIVKIGVSQSTSNLRAHKKAHHSEEYDAIAKRVNLKNPQSTTRGEVVPTSIRNMPGFVAKLNAKCAKLVYHTAAATLAIEEGIPFRTFEQPSFLQLFTPLNHESSKIINLQLHQVKDAVIEMGDYAMEATKREVHNHKIAWTTDHWTGADKATYTTVTVHWIDKKAWSLRSAVLDFKIFEGSTSGERIYEDVMAVLQKYQGDTEDTIVLDTIGITDTTGNMGKLGKYLRDNGKEHEYCTDHNLHLVALTAFDREYDLCTPLPTTLFLLLCGNLRSFGNTLSGSSKCANSGSGYEEST
jgi:hypothetical protein